jgi:hypothetical protein
MTLVISKGITLRKGWQPMDPDAAAYIAAVEAADTEPLEEKTKIAIDNFVLGCKADGIWSAIKASCILAGARTLTGALVPLVGTAPTNVGGLFVSDDYDRKTGLVGDGSTKYLDSNRNNDADPQNSNHNAVYPTSVGKDVVRWIGGNSDTYQTGDNVLGISGGQIFVRQRNNSAQTQQGTPAAGALMAVSRSNSSNYSLRRNGASVQLSQNSQAPSSSKVRIFAGGVLATPQGPTDARFAFYSIGESLDLALLDARVTTLINAFGAAIP